MDNQELTKLFYFYDQGVFLTSNLYKYLNSFISYIIQIAK
jgi:hypothetical protein